MKAHSHFLLFGTQNPPGLYGGRKVWKWYSKSAVVCFNEWMFSWKTNIVSVEMFLWCSCTRSEVHLIANIIIIATYISLTNTSWRQLLVVIVLKAIVCCDCHLQVLSQAFRNRFIELHFNDLPAVELVTILHQKSQLPQSYSKKMVAVMKDLQVSWI